MTKLACATLAIFVLAQASPLALVVLSPQTPQTGRLPDGWQIKRTHGSPDVQVIREEDSSVIRLRSAKSSFGLERGVDVDPAQLPWLTWRWKISELPQGADFRRAAADDQAAQVLVAFADKRVLTYIWDTTAPRGLMQSASSIPLVHIFAIVCRSGSAESNQWLPESHNVAEDYRRAYGRDPVHVKGIRLQINSQHTGTSAESYFGEVAFLPQPLQ